MPCAEPHAPTPPPGKTAETASTRNLEKNSKLRGPARLMLGNQTQMVKRLIPGNRPDTRKANCQSCQSASKVTSGTDTPMLTTLLAMTTPMAFDLLSGPMVSTMAPMLFGGIKPPPSPVIARSTARTTRLGAKAEAITDTVRTSIPARAMGRRPKESDSGPPTTTEAAHAAKVAVASWAATGTDTSISDAMSTSRGGRISAAFWAARTENPRMNTNQVSFSPLFPFGAAGACKSPTPRPAFCRLWHPVDAGQWRRSRSERQHRRSR